MHSARRECVKATSASDSMADSDGEPECRICRGEAEPSNPLFHPCRCSGSIKYTHEECLVNWLAQSGSARCELCHHPFRFEPLYQPDTPRALPAREFISGILSLTKHAAHITARVVLVFAVWLFFLPVGTCWTWYLLFLNSPTQLPALISSRGPAGVVQDAFYGCLLSAGIVFVFLGVSSLREYVRHMPEDDGGDDLDHAAFMMLAEQEENDALLPLDDETDEAFGDAVVDGEQLQPLAPYDSGRDPPAAMDNEQGGEFNNVVDDDSTAGIGDGEAVHEVDALVRDTYDAFAHRGDHAGGYGNPHHDAGPAPVPPPYHDLFADDADYGFADSDRDDTDGDGVPALFEDHDGFVDDDDADILMDAAGDRDDLLDPDEHGDGGALFGLFELDPDEVPLEEVVGLRGHLRNLFDNAGTVLISNAIFLGIFTLIPLIIGRVTLHVVSLHVMPWNALLRGNGTSTELLTFSKIVEAIGGISPAKNVARAALNATRDSGEALAADVAAAATSTSTVALAATNSALKSSSAIASAAVSEVGSSLLGVTTSKAAEPLVSYMDKFFIVLLGYGMISLFAVGYIFVGSVFRSRYPEFDSPMMRQVARMLRYIATFIKIVVLILFEFGIFPLGCGWWLDICTLELVGSTLESRMSFCHDSPWTCTGGHWALGIFYMVHISLFISVLRDVIRPELLWFLRNPDDPEFHPFRELVEKPLSRHARRMCISVVIYVPLVIALVYIPGQLCLSALPSVFPFRLDDFSHSLIDVPFGNLLILPLLSLVHHSRPGVYLQRFVDVWIVWVADILGIAHLVVRDEDAHGGRHGHGHEHDEFGVVGDIPGLEPGDHGPFRRLFGDAEDDGMWDDHQFDDPDEDYFAEHDDVDIPPRAYSDGDADAFMHRIDDTAQGADGSVKIRGAVMIILAWSTMVLGECVLMTVPTVLGRTIIKGFGLPVSHDLHPYGLGFYVLIVLVEVSLRVANYMRTVDTMTALRTGLPYIALALKGIVVVVLWLGVVPLAAGVLLELTLTIPIRVAYNETPYLSLHQDWALGLLLIKLWTRIALAGGFDTQWRERFERAREGGIMGLGPNFVRTIREVVIPVLSRILVALSVPHAISRGLLPLLGASAFVSSVVHRYIYLWIAISYLIFELTRYSIAMIHSLHDSIRDDKYLVGRRLYNFSDSRKVAADLVREGHANQ